jgi:DNA invertase Pin-like site-specific DNA recombinase
MSTDHQQYSPDNQADAVARYATDDGLQIVKSYSDAARSGLQIRNRPGLKQLLKDVVDGGFQFKAILAIELNSQRGNLQSRDQ